MPSAFSRALFFAAGVSSLVLLGAGCAGSSNGPAGPDGGVFRVKGAALDQWKQLKVLDLDTQLGSIADVSTVAAAMDPQDDRALYVGTTDNGLMYSLNGGDSWRSAANVSFGTVNALALHPKDKCVVYAARANQLLKTSDCLRDWNVIVSDARAALAFTALAVDQYNPSIVYAGTSAGDVLRSDNAGASWRPLTRVQGFRVTGLAMDSHDSRIVYVATNGSGILKTLDGGATWQDIYDVLQKYDSARNVIKVVVDPNIAQRLYEVSKYGILRSDDGGASWKALTLVSPPGTVAIRALAVNPLDAHRLVYATDTALVSSNDEGQTWSSKKLPTTRGISFIMFDHQADQSLYVGTVKRAQ